MSLEILIIIGVVLVAAVGALIPKKRKRRGQGNDGSADGGFWGGDGGCDGGCDGGGGGGGD